MPAADVLIVGAGIAGLNCARRLSAARVPLTLLEAEEEPGGRIRTEVFGDFLLDRGFQVFLSAYPEAAQALDYESLDLKSFTPGVLVRKGGRFHRMVDPYRRPADLLATLCSGVGSLMDKVRTDTLRKKILTGSIADHWQRPELTTLEYLRRHGFSRSMIDSFFRPWLSGVFLECELGTSSRMFEFVYRIFAEGRACLPAAGMRAIPRQLAASIPDGHLRISTRVASIRPTSGRSGYYVTTTSGEDLPAAAVVIATEGPEAARLALGASRRSLGPEELPAPGNCAAACMYFGAPDPPYEEAILTINGEGRGPIHSLSVPSNVAATYSPPTLDLICVNIAPGAEGEERELQDAVRAQLRDWYGSKCSDWTHLRTFRIPHALPAQPPGWLEPPQRSVTLEPGLYVCGDHRENASIDGALGSGRRAAEAFLRDHG